MKLTVKQLRKLIKEEVEKSRLIKSTNDGIALKIEKALLLFARAQEAIESGNKKVAKNLIITGADMSYEISKWQMDGGTADAEYSSNPEIDFHTNLHSPVYKDMIELMFEEEREISLMYHKKFGSWALEI